MEPVIIKQGGVTITLPIEKLPTINKEMNRIAADQLMERLKRVLKKNPSVQVLEEFAMIVQDKFPQKQNEHDQILRQAMKDIRHRS